jgi:UDP-N-acetyl-D-galactosamine dehydrogenase
LIVKKRINVVDANLLVMGITFKENCPDVRNTKVVDIIKELKSYQVKITVLDPLADKLSVQNEYGIDIINSIHESTIKKFDCIILAVAHNEFMSMDITKLRSERSVVFDAKGVLPREQVDRRL